jgi:hypothetical protein
MTYGPMCPYLRVSETFFLRLSTANQISAYFPNVSTLIVREIYPASVDGPLTLQGLPRLETLDVIRLSYKQREEHWSWNTLQHPTLKHINLSTDAWDVMDEPLDLQAMGRNCPNLERVSWPDPNTSANARKIQVWVKQPDQTWTRES